MKKLLYTTLLLACLSAPLQSAPTVRIGKPAPKLSSLLPGSKIPNTAGKVVLVDFWASWCGPCRKSFPTLNELHRKYGPKGLVVLGIGVDDDAAAHRRFASKMKASFPLVHDAAHKAAAAFAPSTMPTSYIIDRKGVVRHIHTGFHGAKTKAKYIAEIEALLAKGR